MEKNYYKDYYRLEREHWWFKARGEMLINHLRKVTEDKKDLKILNIGAATGRSSELLMDLGAVTSVEFDPDCFVFTRDVVKISIQEGSILDLRFADGSFDVVCAFDVIEHVDDDAKAVSEMRRVCKTGGILCVTVPAFMFLWSEHDIVNHHFRRYTGKILRGLFEEKDKPIYQTYFNFWLFFPIAAFRLVANWVSPKKNIAPTEAKSDFENFKGGFFNTLFYYVFKSENAFLSRFVRLPLGVSLLSTWQKIGEK